LVFSPPRSTSIGALACEPVAPSPSTIVGASADTSALANNPSRKARMSSWGAAGSSWKAKISAGTLRSLARCSAWS
jgi:hypothetical protein